MRLPHLGEGPLLPLTALVLLLLGQFGVTVPLVGVLLALL